MSGLPGDIGPVSVRYAAQIRALLHSHALERLAAEQQAARDAAHAQSERIQPARQTPKVNAELPRPADAKPAASEPNDAAPAKQARIFNIQV